MGKPAVMQERVKKRFRELGAIGEDNKKTLTELDFSDPDLMTALQQLVKKGIVIEEDNLYYLAEKYAEPLWQRLF